MAYIYKTYSSGGTNNQKKFTASVWVKRCATGVQHEIASAYKASNGFQTDLLKFNSDDTLRFYSHSDSGQGATSFITNAKFRDTSAWYHIVLNVDTTNSTSNERFKMWVNGEQITSWSTSTYPPLNNSMIWGMPTDAVHQIGALNGSHTFNGLMSHFHYVQNAIHAPTVFGQTDSTTGEWSINPSPSGITYSDQSFWFFKNDNLATDRSGNGNNWSTNGTITKTEDNPSNVFATLNHLCNGSNTTLSNGSTVTTGNTASDSGMSTTTLPIASSGKYYWEMKITGSHGDYPKAGIFKNWEAIAQGTMNGASGGAFQLDAYIQKGSTTLFSDDGNITITAPANNNIIMYALDSVNGKFYIGNNGAWYNSGDPTSGSTGTGSVLNLTSGNINMIATHEYNGSVSNWNFGNGYFGTTAVSSAGTNASNNGIFEYDVPTGYTALSTKGLNL